MSQHRSHINTSHWCIIKYLWKYLWNNKHKHRSSMILPYTQVGNASKMSMFIKMDEEESQQCENMEESVIESSSTLDPHIGPAWRIHFALLEYKQFKAARTIQRFIRGFLTRKKLIREKKAATMIAKWWRGYKVGVLFERIRKKHHSVLHSSFPRSASISSRQFRIFCKNE